jgi:hypothetical protein
MGNSLLSGQQNNLFQLAMKFASGKLSPAELIGNNPEAKKIWDETQKMIKEKNGNAEDVFKELCGQNGIDFNQVKQTFESGGIKI